MWRTTTSTVLQSSPNSPPARSQPTEESPGLVRTRRPSWGRTTTIIIITNTSTTSRAGVNPILTRTPPPTLGFPSAGGPARSAAAAAPRLIRGCWTMLRPPQRWTTTQTCTPTRAPSTQSLPELQAASLPLNRKSSPPLPLLPHAPPRNRWTSRLQSCPQEACAPLEASRGRP